MENQVIILDKYEIERKIKMEAIAANYQGILDSVGSITFTRDNVSQDLLQPARKVLEQLKKTKDEIKRPHLDANTQAEAAYKELAQPLEMLISEKIAEKTKIANEIEKERRLIEAEKRRIKEVTDYINSFFTNSVNWLIKEAKTSNDIVTLERRIGVELSRKNYYGDLYDSFVDKCDQIRKILAERKDFIRQTEKLDQKLQKIDGNEEKKAEIIEEKEDLSIFLLQNKTELQKEAYITPHDLGVMVGESTSVPVVAARRQWTYEITDIHELYKRHPELCVIEPNTAAIRAFSSQIRAQQENVAKTEINLPGIRLYQDKKYK
jgi:hypothetical protein